MKKAFLIALIIALVTGLIFGSCAKPVSTTPATTTPEPTTPATTALTPKYGGVLEDLNARLGIPNLGWPFEPPMGIMELNGSCLETLLGLDRKGNLFPWLAESYKVADDYKSITFNLRQGVRFHDGSDFNAEVAKWNLDNYISARLVFGWASVDIIDDYTVRVNFTEWINTLPTTFSASAAPVLCMVSKAAYDKNGVDWMRWHPVGTGPFKFDSYTPDVSLKYVRNPDYWKKDAQGNQLPYLDGLETIYCVDRTTMRLLAESGEGDMLSARPGKEAADYTSLGFTIETVVNSVNSLLPDSAHADSIWANQKVREATEYAIDREAIAKGLGYGYWDVPYQIPPRDCLAYDPDFPLARKYDLEKAKQLLAEAGYPNGFKTTVMVSPMDDISNIAVAVQADLLKVGIQANLDFPDMGKWVTYTGPTGGWHNAAIITPVISHEPTFIEGIRFIDQLWGKSWLRTPEVTQAYQAALDSPTMDFKLARAVTDLITKDALAIPIYSAGQCMAYRPYVVPNFAERSIGPERNYVDWWLNK